MNQYNIYFIDLLKIEKYCCEMKWGHTNRSKYVLRQEEGYLRQLDQYHYYTHRPRYAHTYYQGSKGIRHSPIN